MSQAILLGAASVGSVVLQLGKDAPQSCPAYYFDDSNQLCPRRPLERMHW